MTRTSKAGAAMTLMMLTVMPQARAQPKLTDDTVAQTAIPERQAGPEDSFRMQVRDKMAEWRRKMRTFDETVETRTQNHANAAEARLRTAWDDTEVEARNVQTAAARDWDRTKRAYEAASHRMAIVWGKARL